MSNYILAIDPADTKPMALAANFPILKYLPPIEAGWLYLWSHKLDPDFLLQMFQLAQERVGTLIIEAQFRGMFKGADGKSRVQNNSGLVKASAMIQAPFYASGWKIVDVYPATWHAKVLGNGKVKSAEAKVLSINKASELVGYKIAGDDLADAICIYEWYRKTGGVK